SRAADSAAVSAEDDERVEVDSRTVGGAGHDELDLVGAGGRPGELVDELAVLGGGRVGADRSLVDAVDVDLERSAGLRLGRDDRDRAGGRRCACGRGDDSSSVWN